MPLRDHFRPPLDNITSWEGFHAQWPAVIVQHLKKKLPPGYVAEPRVHRGTQVEIDVATFEKDESPSHSWSNGNGGVATAVWAPATPSVAVETTLPDFDEYEVRVYDAKRGRQLVAAVEIVSPANKDRPEHRNVFVAKCAALLQKGVAVSIVDLVTVRDFNLYADQLAFIGHNDPNLGVDPPALYACWVQVPSVAPWVSCITSRAASYVPGAGAGFGRNSRHNAVRSARIVRRAVASIHIA